MDLRTYLNGLSASQKRDFAQRAATSVNYLRKVLSTNQQVGPQMAIRLSRASDGQISVEALRPDVDWAYLKAAPDFHTAQSANPATERNDR